MGSTLPDRRSHLWARRLPGALHGTGIAHSFGVCGVHIGNFVSKPEDITCQDCLSVICRKLLEAEAIVVTDRSNDWRMHVAGAPEKWECDSTQLGTIKKLIVSRPELLETIAR